MVTRTFSRITASLLAALALATAPGLALADDWDHGDRHGHHDDRRDDRRDWRDDRRDWRDDRRDSRQGYREGYRDADYRPGPPPHAPAWGYRYSRGARYYDAYRGPVYVVQRYPDYHLRRPPPGYHWVRDDRGNFLMVAIATGIIADILLNH